MSADKIESAIVNTLEGLSKSFCEKEGELAYLALTSKPEFAIRDALAFQLYKQLLYKQPFPKYIVAREWKRKDIAILHNGEPEVFLQLKTWSLFTFIKDSRKHFEDVRDDVRKCQRIKRGSRVYSLILATHIDSVPDNRYEGVVKYRSKPNGGWVDAFEQHDTSAQIKRKAVREIDRKLTEWKRVTKGAIPAGQAFDIKASVLYWLFQPKKKE